MRYTLPISTAKIGGREVINNAAAALPGNLPYQPLGWNAITMYVDPKTHSTATLYGNHAAMQAVAPPGASPATAAKSTGYLSGSVLALVTWVQRDDPHWFGGRIPDTPQSVEFVEVAASRQQSRYLRFSGAGLTADHNAFSAAPQRTDFVLGLAPAQLP